MKKRVLKVLIIGQKFDNNFPMGLKNRDEGLGVGALVL